MLQNAFAVANHRWGSLQHTADPLAARGLAAKPHPAVDLRPRISSLRATGCGPAGFPRIRGFSTRWKPTTLQSAYFTRQTSLLLGAHSCRMPPPCGNHTMLSAPIAHATISILMPSIQQLR